jgi:hypothetical protein
MEFEVVGCGQKNLLWLPTSVTTDYNRSFDRSLLPDFPSSWYFSCIPVTILNSHLLPRWAIVAGGL